ncbi:MAG: amino acid adenylation domain-containing protein [Betaproteobacteria bacterium]|nr:amino acid adenylation domain-containing protein [Betaproteobacteria bacterium]
MSQVPSPPGGATEVDYDPFAGETLARVIPTTEPQREVWLACHLDPAASLGYNESVSFDFAGEVDLAALKAAVHDVANRHESLRATISRDGQEMLVAAVANPEFRLTSVAEGDVEAVLSAQRHAAVSRRFDLETGPLLCAHAIAVSARRTVLIVTAHHIVFDGWSAGIFARDLAACYSARLAGRGPDLAPAVSFGDYAIAQRGAEGSERHADDEAYWLSIFKDEIPVLELPLDRPRPPYRTFYSAREDFTLDAALMSAVRDTGKRNGASMVVTLLAAFGATLQRLAGCNDVVVGVPAAAQSVAGLDTLIGHCVNLLPIRLMFDERGDFAGALGVTRSAMLDAVEHQEYTFGTLLKKLPLDRDPSRLPLVSVMFNVDQALDTNALGFVGLDVDFSINPRCGENFELSINAVQKDGALTLECQYNTALFDAATIRRWLAAFETLLRAACADPKTRLAAISLVSQADLERLAAWNRTQADTGTERLVDQLFDAAAAENSAAPALLFADQTWTYAELAARAKTIAAELHARGVRRGDLVGLMIERGPELVASLLAVLRTGAGYVPLDPVYPTDRLSHMATDASLAFLVCGQSLVGKFDWPEEKTLVLELMPDAGSVPAPALANGRNSEDVAYVIYTSGSTGLPKGVKVPHRAVVNFIESMWATPGVRGTDRVMAVTTLSFDIAVNEIIVPLCRGATVILASAEEVADGTQLRALVEKHKVTQMQATPATWRLLLDAGWQGGPHLTALAGGEALSGDLASELLPRSGELWNMYGPTETTVWSTCCRIHAPEAISIGTPIANTTVHVLDTAGNVCPVGVPGEIHIGGTGVTLGYHRRDALNAEKFIADPFRPGGRLYRTGDRGRWRSNGETGQIEHLGRLDFQVKVRGYRIELGEIESQLAGHPSVSRATVLVREDRKGDVRLVAYVVADAPVEDAALTAHLKKTLPDYMVPQHYVRLESIPLLPNGKVDRKSLPPPVLAAPRLTHVAPRTEAEVTIARAFEKFLALPDIGLHDHFFQLGGHSLLASQLAAYLAKEFQLQIPMRAVFEAPTVAQFANWLANRRSDSGSRWTIERRKDQSTAPLSAMQLRMWFLEQLEPGKAVNNSPSAHRLRGQLNQEAFARAFAEMVRRQHALRTIVEMHEGQPRQRILAEVPTALLPAIDLRSLPPEEREPVMMREIVESIRTPFDLGVPPLFRARLYRLDEEEHVFFFMPHHMVWDGWSFDLLYHDMATIYGAFVEGKRSPLPELDVSYGDYSAWHNGWMQSEDMAKEIRHWTARLSGTLEPLAVPTDYPRPEVLSGNAGMMWLPVAAQTVERVRRMATEENATVFMTLLSVYVLMLHQLTGQRDFVIGTPVRGRQIAELEPIMGFFVNALPLRFEIPEGLRFRDLLADVKARALDAFSHPDVPFERLVQELNVPRDRSRTPIAQTMFSYQDARKRIVRWGNVDRERVEVMQPGVAGDLNLWCVELPNGLLFGFSFAPELFSSDTAKLLRDRYLHILEAVLANPAQAIATLPVSNPERHLLEQWNATQAPYDRSARLHSAFEAQARQQPDKIAVRCGNQSHTYRSLDEEAERLAAVMRARGIGRGSLVGICVERGTGMLGAVLAVLKCGSAYVPLDPDYPEVRLRMIRDDAHLALTIATDETLGMHPWLGSEVINLDRLPDAAARATAGEPPQAPAGATGEDPAYVIFTSGSTGRPKGVVVPHRAAVNFLTSMSRQPGLAAADRLLAVTTLSFDISVLELFLPLTVGAEVVIATREQSQDGAALRSLLGTAAATCMQATPATWRMLLESGWSAPVAFKALVGGEALPAALGKLLLAKGAEVWNMYGPTETTVWSTCWKVSEPERGVLIGRPIANTSVWVLDQDRRMCPIGVAGELWIGGDGVALGYLDRADLTADRFMDSPFGAGKLYRTGDRGRWRSDGMLEHMGRLDFQVKIRGFRIELGEIESCFAGIPGVGEAVVMAREDEPGDVRLVAYCVPVPGHSIDAGALRERAKQVLPPYMVPQHVVSLNAIPRLPNGKVDRKGFSRPVAKPVAVAQIKAPSTETERALVEIWSELLKVDKFGVDENFFDLGGHSLLGMQAIALMEKKCGKRVNPRRYIFETLEQIARAYDDSADAPAERPGALRRIFGKLTNSKS